jgi:hypothetical protein
MSRTPQTGPATGPSELVILSAAGGNPAIVARDLDRLLAEDGVPRLLPVSSWWPLVAALDQARRSWPVAWPDPLLARVRTLVEATLRFSRPDGSAVFGPSGVPADRATLLRRWATTLADPGIGTVSRWWFGRRGGSGPLGAPPLPAFGDESRPLAVLRADWTKTGDAIVVDHRDPASGGLLEVMAGGSPLLGPSWTTGATPPGRAAGSAWKTGSSADFAEWTFRVGGARVVRTAVLLRCRQFAILADEWHGAEGDVSTRFALAPGVAAAPIPDSRAQTLKTASGGVSARAIPIGLPALPYATERGAFASEGGDLVLTQRAAGRRVWLPLLLSWDKARNRRLPRWRVLTVSEKSQACPPGVAFAARVGWGPGDGLVVYRSLGRTAVRTFLGHQTSARFLVGLFNENGDVVPLLRIDG